MENKVSEYSQRIEKAEELRAQGVNPYANDFKPENLAKEVTDGFDSKTKEELLENKVQVSIAGRVIAVRSFGKAAFVKIRDRSGELQVYIKKDRVGEESFNVFKKVDVGDYIGAVGALFRTKTDELTVDAAEFKILVKGLRPLPEKFHGLTNVEQRYRQRYLDLIANPEVKEIFLKRSKIVTFIRDYLTTRDYVEVETPMMHHIPGGAAARPFVTHHNTLDTELYLRIAPELYLKRLLVGGIDRVFEINRNFRNEGVSTQHNPEFTMLEFYEAYATFEDLMNLTEDMISKLAKEVCGSEVVTYQGKEINFKGPWKRITVYDAIREYTDAGEEIFTDKKAAYDYSKKIGLDMPEEYSHGKIVLEIFEEKCEAKFIEPTFVTHYPLDVSPLSRKNEEDPTLVDRFELIVNGKEIANAFSELNDPIDQKARFMQQAEERDAGDGEAHLMDEDFVRALEYGMPPAAGQGIGIDRLVMLLTDSASIRDVILFPLLRKE